MRLVGSDDALNERMADYVAFVEFHDGDAVNTLQRGMRFHQSGMLVRREIDLGDVAGDDGLGPVAQTGQEHEHLLGGGVLGFVQDDEKRD